MKSPAFLLYVRDIISSDTIERLHEEDPRGVAAYLYLLCKSWIQDPPATLPDDQKELRRMARLTPEEWARIWPIMSPKFVSDGNGRLYNERLHSTWERQQERRTSGRKGGKSKGGK
jgi:uncharacterized protein YdaU (DUF1376 family)